MIDPTAQDQDPAHWTVATLLANRPAAEGVLLGHGMACVGCVMARFETLSEAADVYHLDLHSLLKEMRETRAGRQRQGARRRGRVEESRSRRPPEGGG